VDAGALIVETRPAVQWVAELPETWTNASQRLVLLVLACDSFEGNVSRPGVENLAAWCGLSPRATYEALQALTHPLAGVRPRLVARVDRYGRPIPEGVKRGRERTGYLLFPEGLPTMRSAAGLGTTVRPPAGLAEVTMRSAAELSAVVCGQPSANPAVSRTLPALPSTNSSPQVTTDEPSRDDEGPRPLRSRHEIRREEVRP
jgi:hypothetical protein